MPSAFAEVLRALASALGEIGADYYVFGAQAALVHGSVRLTADVDVTVRMVSEDPQALVATAQRHGLETRIRDSDFVARTRVLPLVHQRTGINVDVVLAGPGIEDLFLERAELREIEGVALYVARAEDVIVMKVLAGRPKDLQDVAAIVAAQEHLDTAMVRETLRLLEQALNQSDLIPQFDSITSRIKGY